MNRERGRDEERPMAASDKKTSPRAASPRPERKAAPARPKVSGTKFVRRGGPTTFARGHLAYREDGSQARTVLQGETVVVPDASLGRINIGPSQWGRVDD